MADALRSLQDERFASDSVGDREDAEDAAVRLPARWQGTPFMHPAIGEALCVHRREVGRTCWYLDGWEGAARRGSQGARDAA